MADVQVIGAGGHARVVISTLREAGHTVTAVWDDDPATWGTRCLDAPIRGGLAELATQPALPTVIAVGNNRARAAIAATLELPWSSVVHPRAWVDRTARLGAGTVVFAGAIVQPQVEIGAHAIVNTAASIDHDCRIGDHAHIGPGVHLCGDVVVGAGTLPGVSSCARPGARIGEWAIVGAGSVVVRSVASNTTVVGVPATPIAERR